MFPPYNSVQRTPKTKLKLPGGFRLVLAPDLNCFLESARPVFRQFEGPSFRQPFLRAERGLWKLILWSNFTIVLGEDPLGTHVRGVYKKDTRGHQNKKKHIHLPSVRPEPPQVEPHSPYIYRPHNLSHPVRQVLPYAPPEQAVVEDYY